MRANKRLRRAPVVSRQIEVDVVAQVEGRLAVRGGPVADGQGAVFGPEAETDREKSASKLKRRRRSVDPCSDSPVSGKEEGVAGVAALAVRGEVGEGDGAAVPVDGRAPAGPVETLSRRETDAFLVYPERVRF